MMLSGDDVKMYNFMCLFDQCLGEDSLGYSLEMNEFGEIVVLHNDRLDFLLSDAINLQRNLRSHAAECDGLDP